MWIQISWTDWRSAHSTQSLNICWMKEWKTMKSQTTSVNKGLWRASCQTPSLYKWRNQSPKCGVIYSRPYPQLFKLDSVPGGSRPLSSPGHRTHPLIWKPDDGRASKLWCVLLHRDTLCSVFCWMWCSQYFSMNNAARNAFWEIWKYINWYFFLKD